MKFYAERSNQYFWEIDRFMFFTESEKCSIFDALKEQYGLWKGIDEEKNGIASMLKDLLDELDKVI